MHDEYHFLSRQSNGEQAVKVTAWKNSEHLLQLQSSRANTGLQHEFPSDSMSVGRIDKLAEQVRLAFGGLDELKFEDTLNYLALASPEIASPEIGTKMSDTRDAEAAALNSSVVGEKCYRNDSILHHQHITVGATGQDIESLSKGKGHQIPTTESKREITLPEEKYRLSYDIELSDSSSGDEEELSTFGGKFCFGHTTTDPASRDMSENGLTHMNSALWDFDSGSTPANLFTDFHLWRSATRRSQKLSTGGHVVYHLSTPLELTSHVCHAPRLVAVDHSVSPLHSMSLTQLRTLHCSLAGKMEGKGAQHIVCIAYTMYRISIIILIVQTGKCSPTGHG